MLTISVIIPVKPGVVSAACRHLEIILADAPEYEVFLVEGRAPSRQRNLAAQKATGDILYFMDDDALMNAENFLLCNEAMENREVAVVGGPSLTPDTDSWLQQLFGNALSSLIGSGPVRNRYRMVGTIRTTTDKELILCNLAVRRDVFLAHGGFNESLYPNEENEFLERLAIDGNLLLHVPSMSVMRSQRKTVWEFVRQMFNYGRGRAEQSRISSSYPVLSFIPLFFVVYLCVAAANIKYPLVLLPLVIYIGAVLISMLWELWRSKWRWSLVLLIGIYPLMHIVNGVGLLYGLIGRKPAPVIDGDIRIRKIKEMGKPFVV
jgi:glycosyltransferase involved in cell wall biosynthesis